MCVCMFIKDSGGEENREGEEMEGEWGRGESVEMKGKKYKWNGGETWRGEVKGKEKDRGRMKGWEDIKLS